MSSTVKRRMDLDERRSQLLDLGIRLFSERAYEDVSVDDIAEAAGVSKGLLYHYFGGKADFHAACVALGAERLVSAVMPDPALPVPARAVAALDAYLAFVRDHSRPYLVVQRGGGGEQVARIVAETRERIVSAALEAVPADERGPLTEVSVHAWVGAVERASLVWLRTGQPDEATLRRLLLGALVGLRGVADASSRDPA